MSTSPRPPVNVVLVMADGRELPVDTVYAGERDGTHHWEVVNAPPGRVRQVRIDQLPPHTSVGFALTSG